MTDPKRAQHIKAPAISSPKRRLLPSIGSRLRPTSDAPAPERSSIELRHSHDAGVLTPLLQVGKTEIDLSETAIHSFNSLNPTERWWGMVQALINQIARARVGGIALGEYEALVALATILIEAQDGNYSNAAWPDEPAKKARHKSFDRSRAEAHTMAAAAYREALDKCKPMEACSRTAFDIDEILRGFGTRLANELNPYDDRERSRRGNRTLRGESRTHFAARRIHDWCMETSGERPDFKTALRQMDQVVANGLDRAEAYERLIHIAAMEFVRSSRGKQR